MRLPREEFDNCEPVLIYIAKRLKEALRLEEVLTQAGIDYLVEPDVYIGGVIFRRERVGAFFYVRPEAVESARQAMQRYGFKPWSLE